MGNEVLEHQVSIIKVENPNVSIGLSNEDLIRFRNCAANWINSLFQVFRGVHINGFDYFRGPYVMRSFFMIWQLRLPNSNVAVVTTSNRVNNFFDVDKNAHCGINGSRVQQLST
jgi:hypothetical protein